MSWFTESSEKPCQGKDCCSWAGKMINDPETSKATYRQNESAIKLQLCGVSTPSESPSPGRSGWRAARLDSRQRFVTVGAIVGRVFWRRACCHGCLGARIGSRQSFGAGLVLIFFSLVGCAGQDLAAQARAVRTDELDCQAGRSRAVCTWRAGGGRGVSGFRRSAAGGWRNSSREGPAGSG